MRGEDDDETEESIAVEDETSFPTGGAVADVVEGINPKLELLLLDEVPIMLPLTPLPVPVLAELSLLVPV
jgi:hypothetical protein